MNQEVLDFLAAEYAGNSVRQYIVAVVVFICVWMLLPFIKRLIVHELKRLDENIKGADLGFFVNLFDRIHGSVFPVIAFYAASQPLTLNPKAERTLDVVAKIIIVLQVIALASYCVTYFVNQLHLGKNDLATRSARNNLNTIGKGIVWVGGILFLLSNLGIDVSTLITGLGVGGIAVALAAQAILGDTFSSFTISLDKPFEVGDFVVVDTLKGTVEQIGLKTTRIRSQSGELLVFANSDLTKARIQNFQRIQSRRAVIKLAVPYDTPTDRFESIPGLIKQAVEGMPKTRFDRAHFVEFGLTGLNFEAVYYVDTAEYNVFMDTQQTINFKLRREFESREINMVGPVTATPPAAGAPQGTPVGSKA